jgi:GNAT superfamily N-acetyltransferase
MIRPATHADIPRIVELGALMWAESPRFSAYPFLHERAAETIRNIIDLPAGCLLVAEGPQGIVGGIMAILAPHWACDFVQACDMALFLTPEARGGSTAARLVKAYRDWAMAKGAEVTMGVSTGIQTERTGQLFQALGAKQSGTIWTWGNESCAQE